MSQAMGTILHCGETDSLRVTEMSIVGVHNAVHVCRTCVLKSMIIPMETYYFLFSDHCLLQETLFAFRDQLS